MSSIELRLETLNIARVDAGIAYCVEHYGHETVMGIDPATIEMNDSYLCMLAQSAGVSFEATVSGQALSYEDQIRLGFYGDKTLTDCDSITATRMLTPICRKRLREYQTRHRTTN
jgi:hypothetical protein